MKNFIYGILASIFATVIVAAIVQEQVATPKNLIDGLINKDITIPFYLVLICMIAIIAIFVFIVRRGYTYYYKGDDALNYAIKLIKKLDDITNPKVFRSTRLNNWTQLPTKSPVISFRELLTKLIKNDRHDVRRLWIIRNDSDLARLKSVALEYQNCMSITIKYMHIKDCPQMIEMHIISDELGAIGIPTRLSGGTTGLQVEIKDKIVLQGIGSYFDTLFEQAQFALENGRIDNSFKADN